MYDLKVTVSNSGDQETDGAYHSVIRASCWLEAEELARDEVSALIGHLDANLGSLEVSHQLVPR